MRKLLALVAVVTGGVILSASAQANPCPAGTHPVTRYTDIFGYPSVFPEDQPHVECDPIPYY